VIPTARPGSTQGCGTQPEGTRMASKDKGGRSSKTAAASTAKEKKAAKRDKKDQRDKKDRAV
jgi:hypothetical protein